MNNRRRATREYRVALSNGKTLRIVAPSPQRAYGRADAWCKKVNTMTPDAPRVSIGTIVEIED